MRHKTRILLFLLSAAIYSPVLFRMQTSYDFVIHAKVADKMAKTGSLLTPHFLFQALQIPLAQLLFGNYLLAETLVAITAAAVTAVVIQRFLDNEVYSPALLLLPLFLLLASPILLPAFYDGHLYFGFLGINVFHNPTILLLKPLALVSFSYAATYSRGGNRATPLQTSIACLVTILAATAKPSFTICIIPALMLMTAILLLRRTRPDWTMLIVGFILPSIVILLFQYVFTYSNAQVNGVYEGKSSIALAPFLVMGAISSLLPLKFFCSALFPLVAIICFPGAANRDRDLQLAWIAFFFGAAYSYLLAEPGPRILHGNFLWSGQITLFILFVVSTRFLIRQTAESRLSTALRRDWRLLSCSIIFSLHLLSGVVFYAAEFYGIDRFW